MAMEVSCGQCHERLMIETPGVVVACPHCGAHLSIPGVEAETHAEHALDQNLTGADKPEPTESAAASLPPVSVGVDPIAEPPGEQTATAVPIAESPSGPDFSWMSPSEPVSAINAPTILAFAGLDIARPHIANDVQGFAPVPEASSDVQTVASSDSTGFSFSVPDEPNKLPPPSDPFGLGPSGDLATSPRFETSTLQPIGASFASQRNDEVDPSAFVAPSPSAPVRHSGAGQSMLLLMIGSYASLITIYAIYLTLFGRKHQLESLPDLKTVQQQGGRAVVPRPENFLPPGHELRLGQSERYGNIRVTPLRVTRGPLLFSYFDGTSKNTRDPSDPVLKLWLKFENVSETQPITPIDTTLMYFQRHASNVISYNVIFRDADRKNKNAQFFYNFDRLPAESEWMIVGQDTNRELAPHDAFETFIPSEERVEGLTGDLIWRVHFRKGHGPESGNGVTTLIDVRFNGNDIEPDPGSKATS
jgi:hypothetical protein